MLGDPSTGFIHNITRNHGLNTVTPPPVELNLGMTSFEYLDSNTRNGDGDGDGGDGNEGREGKKGKEVEYEDSEARNAVEYCALSIAAPGKSLRSVHDTNLVSFLMV